MVTSIREDITGVILAGGRGTRFHGRNKALIQINGGTILDRLCKVLSSIFDHVLLITNAPQDYLAWDIAMASDLFGIRSSLTGIHAALFHATTPYVFCTACDTPFLQPELIRLIVGRMDGRYEVVMPETGKGTEALCAVYAKTCLPRIEQAVIDGRLKILRVFRQERIGRVPESEIRKVDPDLISFFNINTPQDLETARRLVQPSW